MYQASYQKNHCYQYDVRLKNFEQDLREANLTENEIKDLKVSDFKFEFIQKENKLRCHEITKFIERHEWLGKMPNRPTHRFIASYNGKLAGVIVMATPNSFSNLLGKENRNLEKLISRGACISWSPKNLGSALVMFAVRWMAKNTDFRYFTAYSDTEARELGTIYQACNFIYLGQNSGARCEYFDADKPSRGWFSDRVFRKASSFKRYSMRLGIEWQSHWNRRDKILWDIIPMDILDKLRAEAQRHQDACEHRVLDKKHKYVYILGPNARETKKFRNVFNQLHSEKIPYPKVRVALPAQKIQLIQRPTKIAAQATGKNAATPNFAVLTMANTECRPQGQTHFLSIKEAARMFHVSDWTLYQLIRTDPSFPALNVGIKKKFVIEPNSLDAWFKNRSKRQRDFNFDLPNANELWARSKR